MAEIAKNRKALHDYSIEERLEAGMVLEGWEVKAIRAGRAQISEAHVMVKAGEAWVVGMSVAPLEQADANVACDPTRTRKLLLNAQEISRLIGKTERAGMTLIPLDLHFSKGLVKMAVGLAKGKKQHDKRDAEKAREWEMEKARVMRAKAR